MLDATMIAFFSDMLATAVFQEYFFFQYCTVKFPIIYFVVIIRTFRNVIVVGYILESEHIIVRLFHIIIVRLFKCNQDCYCDYCCLLIVLNYVRFRLRLLCPGILVSLYGHTFHVTPVDLGIIFQCTLYISCIMSCGNKFVSNCFKLFQIVSSANTFPVGELGGWKHTFEFQKPSKTNLHLTLLHLGQ